MGCLTVFFRLLTEAILVRVVGRIVTSLFDQGKLGQWTKRVFDAVVGNARRLFRI
jgi:hypothetical protein